MSAKSAFILGFFDDEPYARRCAVNNHCGELGPGMEIELITSALHLVRPNVNLKFLEFENADALTNAISEDHVNISANFGNLQRNFANVSARVVLDYCSGGHVLISQRPIAQVAVRWLLFSVFQWSVWLILAFLIPFIYGSTMWLRICTHARYPVTRHCIQIAWYGFLAIFLEVYSNLLTVNIAVPTFRSSLPYKNVLELATLITSGTCIVYSPYSVKRLELILFNDNEDRSLQSALEKHLIVLPDRQLVRDALINSTKCAVAIDYNPMGALYESISCGRLVTNENFFRTMPQYYGNILSKETYRMRDVYNTLSIISANRATCAYTKHLAKVHTESTEADCANCGVGLEQRKELESPLRLFQLAEAFGLLGFGMLIASIGLSLELYCIKPKTVIVTICNETTTCQTYTNARSALRAYVTATLSIKCTKNATLVIGDHEYRKEVVEHIVDNLLSASTISNMFECCSTRAKIDTQISKKTLKRTITKPHANDLRT